MHAATESRKPRVHPPPRGVADLAGVEVRRERVRFPTYEPATPDRNPMFLEKRVYQGSNGKVYPLPMIDRIADKPVSRAWDVIWIENAYLKVMVLPAIGGRIHALVDKTTGHDLIYRQEVIKPALVGLAGPWLSGGIEFNWPQHHRPATFMPTDVEVEALPDGGKIVWCGDHDPLERMKGMHGVCLRPGMACLELRVRVHNRTPHVRTFLWWANVATRVHEAYRSFFSPDVRFVADHARRSMSRYPRCDGKYYGVDYGNRGREGVPVSEIPRRFVPPHVKSGTGPRVAGGSRREDADLPAYSADDLSYYANIPVPTSYMCLGSRGGFFGGYDYRLRTGIVHVADRFISPGKKQWTWGNHEFGYAWDGNLTDPGNDGVPAPYIELMAGVYTDNQPDFSFLGPGETRTWTQRWYPIHRLGPVDEANADAAVCLSRSAQGWRVGVEATRRFPKAKIVFVADGTRRVWRRDLEPGRPFVVEVRGRAAARSAEILVDDSEDSRIVAFRSRAEPTEDTVPPPASEPEAPREMASVDRLYLTGLHLAQYRHATRCPTLYWKEALRRDSGDSRCNTAMGVWHMARGEFRIAEGFLRRAIQRISERNANPYDGEAHYQLGLCLRYLGMDEAAYEALAKATWNQAWRAAASVALAEIDCRRRAWAGAREHLERALTLDSGNLRARNLLAMVHRVSGSVDQGGRLVRETLAMDRLDAWARVLSGRTVRADLQTRLDVAHDLATAGFLGEAIGWLTASLPGDENRDPRNLGAWPMVGYTLAWLYERRGDAAAARAAQRRAAATRPDHCFPARLEEIEVLESAMRRDPADARAPYYLGNLLYDRRRHAEAMELWERSARLDPSLATVWRNLGIGEYNVRRRPRKARDRYERAIRCDPFDARLVYERDQLWKRTGVGPERRLVALRAQVPALERRDDLCLEYCALLNQTGRHAEAESLLRGRRFQPWEGGEGVALAEHVRTQLALGYEALGRGDAVDARDRFRAALDVPANLGEARHLLANPSPVHWALGLAYERLGDRQAARGHWELAAGFVGDFQDMRPRGFSETTYYSALAWGKLGRPSRRATLLKRLAQHAGELAEAPATIDYFATSLPTMLLFDDDPKARQTTTALLLEAQAAWGLGHRTRALSLCRRVLRRDPNHGPALDFRRHLAFLS